MILLCFEVFIFTYAKFRENKTHAKISEFTVWRANNIGDDQTALSKGWPLPVWSASNHT